MKMSFRCYFSLFAFSDYKNVIKPGIKHCFLWFFSLRKILQAGDGSKAGAGALSAQISKGSVTLRETTVPVLHFVTSSEADRQNIRKKNMVIKQYNITDHSVLPIRIVTGVQR
jgi:hypothetical protein